MSEKYSDEYKRIILSNREQRERRERLHADRSRAPHIERTPEQKAESYALLCKALGYDPKTESDPNPPPVYDYSRVTPLPDDPTAFLYESAFSMALLPPPVPRPPCVLTPNQPWTMLTPAKGEAECMKLSGEGESA